MTGFRAYHTYNVVKYIYFCSKKYDITKMSLPKKKVFLEKWNNEMINRKDSLFFLKLDKLFNDKELIFLFACYYLQNKDFYIIDIINDDFKLYKKYNSELNMLKDILEKDLYTIYYLAIKNKISLKQILFSKKGLPKIFQIYDREKISIHSLIAFHLVWGIGNKISMKSINIVEEEKIKKYKIIFDKYLPIVYKYYNFDVKNFLKECIKNLNK